jgi:hypothetical protein
MVGAGRFWLIGLVDSVLWIDRLFLKSLRRAVPDLDLLLADPARRLSEQPITIGPRRRYATATFSSLLLAIVNWFCIWGVFVALIDWRKGPPAQRPDGPFLLSLLAGAMLGALVAAILFMMWVCRGGQMVLKQEGVELRHRRSVVCCPWALFHAPGVPFRPGGGKVLLPIQAEVVPLVELLRKGHLVARGKAIKCQQLKFKGEDRAVLGALYVVRTGELAELLLHLGRTLGAGVAEEAPAGLGGTITSAHPGEG